MQRNRQYGVDEGDTVGERSWAFTRMVLPPVVLVGAAFYVAGVAGLVAGLVVAAVWVVWMMGRS